MVLKVFPINDSMIKTLHVSLNPMPASCLHERGALDL